MRVCDVRVACVNYVQIGRAAESVRFPNILAVAQLTANITVVENVSSWQRSGCTTNRGRLSDVFVPSARSASVNAPRVPHTHACHVVDPCVLVRRVFVVHARKRDLYNVAAAPQIVDITPRLSAGQLRVSPNYRCVTDRTVLKSEFACDAQQGFADASDAQTMIKVYVVMSVYEGGCKDSAGPVSNQAMTSRAHASASSIVGTTTAHLAKNALTPASRNGSSGLEIRSVFVEDALPDIVRVKAAHCMHLAYVRRSGNMGSYALLVLR